MVGPSRNRNLSDIALAAKFLVIGFSHFAEAYSHTLFVRSLLKNPK